MKPVSLLTFVILILISVLHLLRLILGTEVRVGLIAIPMVASIAAMLFFAALAVGFWREHRTPPGA